MGHYQFPISIQLLRAVSALWWSIEPNLQPTLEVFLRGNPCRSWTWHWRFYLAVIYMHVTNEHTCKAQATIKFLPFISQLRIFSFQVAQLSENSSYLTLCGRWYLLLQNVLQWMTVLQVHSGPDIVSHYIISHRAWNPWFERLKSYAQLFSFHSSSIDHIQNHISQLCPQSI